MDHIFIAGKGVKLDEPDFQSVVYVINFRGGHIILTCTLEVLHLKIPAPRTNLAKYKTTRKYSLRRYKRTFLKLSNLTFCISKTT